MQSSKYFIWFPQQNPYDPQIIIPNVSSMVKLMLTIYFTVYLKVIITFKGRPTDRFII